MACTKLSRVLGGRRTGFGILQEGKIAASLAKEQQAEAASLLSETSSLTDSNALQQRTFYAGSKVMHAAKVRGQRETPDYQEEYPGIVEGPGRGRFIPKSEEEVMDDHRKNTLLRCMGASLGQAEVLTWEAQQSKRRFITPAVILEVQNQLAHHHHHYEEDDHGEEELTEGDRHLGAAAKDLVRKTKDVVQDTAQSVTDAVKSVGAGAKKSVFGRKEQSRGFSSAANHQRPS